MRGGKGNMAHLVYINSEVSWRDKEVDVNIFSQNSIIMLLYMDI